jgi:hypothetical protein
MIWNAVMAKKTLWRAAISATIMLAALTGTASADAGEESPAATTQWQRMSALIGEWRVEEQPSLRIVFEGTAGGSVLIEKWMVGQRMHSLTIYHRNGENLMATHYCPQGNQPRLTSTESENGEIKFAFLDATDLDPDESYQHDLSFKENADGSMMRRELYWAPTGPGDESAYTLFRVTNSENSGDSISPLR